MKFVRLLLLWLVISSVVYFAVSVYVRSLRRESLEKRWAENNPGGDLVTRDAYVEQGVEQYEEGPWPTLLKIGIYVVPLIFIVVVHIFTTYY